MVRATFLREKDLGSRGDGGADLALCVSRWGGGGSGSDEYRSTILT